jgi:membrane-associated phospholipid phosphatase
MQPSALSSLAVAPWRQHAFLAFTALSLLVCVISILWLDVPLARWLHAHSAGAVPFFAAFTEAVDVTYAVTLRNWLGWPALFWALGLAYVLGRWVLRWQSATVFLITLLTHVSSEVSANLLKVAVHRPRPAVLFEAGPVESFSFPSGHTAIYWSLFLPLAVAFPRWRWPLLVVPGLVSLGRLVLGVHYLSDVWAAIWLVAAWTMLFGLLRRWG